MTCEFISEKVNESKMGREQILLPLKLGNDYSHILMFNSAINRPNLGVIRSEC